MRIAIAFQKPLLLLKRLRELLPRQMPLRMPYYLQLRRHRNAEDERLTHIVQHPEMANMESAIQDTLIKPEVVRKSKTDDSVHLYYQYREGTIVGDRWLCIVVKSLEDDAFIITAYLTDKLKQGEQIWPNP